MNKNVESKAWSGRFTQSTDAFVLAFTASESFDRRLYAVDIQGSVAHASMLQHIGILSADECAQICTGLQQINDEITADRFEWSVEREDVHMNIEARLVALIGDVGKKLHTGRSRNDQVATDMRLYLRQAVDEHLQGLSRLQNGLLDLAEREADTIMPGFTHLQTAQPITFGFHMLAWNAMLQRDRERFQDARRRINRMPLGAAALAGSPYPLDRQHTADLLGFEAICENALDAVSDRDFAIEYCHAAAVLMMHLSRFSEEMVNWNSAQFGFIDLPDAFCTGSSIMPQKKNPDVPELVRGKTARVYGHLMALLTLMKGQPLAYNKDNQEDKEPLFDTIDTINNSLRAFADLIPELRCCTQRMRAAAEDGYATATDLADYLVGRGIAFRDAHEIVGKVVRYGIDHKLKLHEFDLPTLQRLVPQAEQDLLPRLTVEGSVAARNSLGGTAPEQVRYAIGQARQQLA